MLKAVQYESNCLRRWCIFLHWRYLKRGSKGYFLEMLYGGFLHWAKLDWYPFQSLRSMILLILKNA